jgi:pimeloyl-ACP methyl ester carboxylesterase
MSWAPFATHSTTLRDGRALCWSEHGDPDGRPLLFFHGFPGSRLEAAMVRAEAKRRRVRIVAMDRPGIGGSQPAPGRALLDWPGDVEQLLDALELERAPLVGVSGGVPYALACAHRIPERLTEVGLVCGLGPIHEAGVPEDMVFWNRLGLRAGRALPALARPVLGLVAPVMRRRPQYFVRRLWHEVDEADAAVLADPELRDILASTFAEAFRRGAAGPADDARIYVSPWGFAASEVAKPVRLWHGEADRVVPVAMGRYLARTLPACEARILPGEGHFSIVVRRCEELLRALVR